MYGMMLAGVSSNVGKTTVTMGVMAAYKAMGQRVVPFKTGPDYIDPMFHTFVTDNPSANLDTWMVDPEMIKTLYYGKLGPEDLGIVEGVMGLYDGHSAGISGAARPSWPRPWTSGVPGHRRPGHVHLGGGPGQGLRGL